MFRLQFIKSIENEKNIFVIFFDVMPPIIPTLIFVLRKKFLEDVTLKVSLQYTTEQSEQYINAKSSERRRQYLTYVEISQRY